MAQPLRAGLVGCGSLAQRGILPHLSEPDARERVQLVAVTDAVAERARASAEQFGVAHHFDDIGAMLAMVDLDLIIVATPITQHYEHAMAAVAAGKHVYVQKAMTVTLDEANQLIAARDRVGVKLAAAPGYTLFPFVERLREAAESLGGVYMAYTYTMGFGHEREPIRAGEGVLAAIDPSWYYRAGAGPLPDVTVYALQLITSLLGPVRRVTALANTRNPLRQWRGQSITIETPDNNVVLMEFASGSLAVAVGCDSYGSIQAPWGGVEMYGAQGTLAITDVDMASGYPMRYTIRGREASEGAAILADQRYIQGRHLDIEEPHVYADIMDLADAILEDRAPRATAEQARHVVEIIECARRATASGQTQELTTLFAHG